MVKTALLGLAPNSPDAAIFTNATAAPTTTTTTPATAGQSAPETANGMTKLGPGYAGLVVAVAVSIVFLASPPAAGSARL